MPPFPQAQRTAPCYMAAAVSTGAAGAPPGPADSVLGYFEIFGQCYPQYVLCQDSVCANQYETYTSSMSARWPKYSPRVHDCLLESTPTL